MDTIEQQVRDTIAKVTGLPPDVDGTRDLYFDLGVASVHALMLLSELEERFAVAIPDDEFVSATTVESITALMSDLASHTAGSSSNA